MPLKKPDIELGLEFTNQLRDRGLRDAETSCRSEKFPASKTAFTARTREDVKATSIQATSIQAIGPFVTGVPRNEPEAKPVFNIGKSFDCYVTVKRRP